MEHLGPFCIYLILVVSFSLLVRQPCVKQGLINEWIFILKLELRGKRIPLILHVYVSSFCVLLHATSAIQLDIVHLSKPVETSSSESCRTKCAYDASHVCHCENEHMRRGSG